MNIHVPTDLSQSASPARKGELDHQTELALARAWRDRGDRRARDRLILAHRRLALGAVARLGGKAGTEAHDDLMQQAFLGLMKAADRFDPDKGVRFSTYARWWIRAEVQEYRIRNWSMVQVGSSAAQKMVYVHARRLENRFGQEEGRSPGGDELEARLATAMGLPRERIAVLRERMAVRDVPLDYRPSDDDETGEPLDIIDETCPDPELETLDRLSGERLHGLLVRGLAELPARERAILNDYYLADPPRTLSEMAREHGVSRERVRQIREQGMRKLKRHFADLPTDAV